MMNSSGSTVVGMLGAYASFSIIVVENDAIALDDAMCVFVVLPRRSST